MADDLEAHVCGECGIRWAAPARWWATRREDKKTFYCPNGCPRAFVESEADRLRRERDRLKQENARLCDEAHTAWTTAAQAERQARAFKGVATRIKNRVSAGVCPCCNRTFQQLAAHMAKKHPGYAAAELTVDGVTIQ